MIFDLFRNEKVMLCRIYYLNFKILFISFPFFIYLSLSMVYAFIGRYFHISSYPYIPGWRLVASPKDISNFNTCRCWRDFLSNYE